jgi:hypothetical protein
MKSDDYSKIINLKINNVLACKKENIRKKDSYETRAQYNLQTKRQGMANNC